MHFNNPRGALVRLCGVQALLVVILAASYTELRIVLPSQMQGHHLAEADGYLLDGRVLTAISGVRCGRCVATSRSAHETLAPLRRLRLH